MLDSRILIRSLSELEVKIMLCKSAFEWELLAKKYEDVKQKIELFFNTGEIPESILSALNTARASLVKKKGEMPPADLSDFFK